MHLKQFNIWYAKMDRTISRNRYIILVGNFKSFLLINIIDEKYVCRRLHPTWPRHWYL